MFGAIISKHIAAYAGVFDLFVQGRKNAALVLLHVISMSPIPGMSIIGYVGLYLLGAQSGNELMMAIALGVVPGGVIVKKFIWPMKNMLMRTVGRSVQYLTRLAMSHSVTMKLLSGARATGSAIGRGGGRAIALGWRSDPARGPQGESIHHRKVRLLFSGERRGADRGDRADR